MNDRTGRLPDLTGDSDQQFEIYTMNGQIESEQWPLKETILLYCESIELIMINL